jgi:hypothetical protein
MITATLSMMDNHDDADDNDDDNDADIHNNAKR